MATIARVEAAAGVERIEERAGALLGLRADG
jgi:hypothetical protein